MARFLCVLAAVAAVAVADDTKRVKDPVVRHDAKQCGQYMCPAYPNAAEKYILNGCSGDFDSFASSTTLSAAASQKATGISSTSFLTFASLSGLVALAVGFVAGKHGARSPGYLPVRTKFDYDVGYQ